MTKQTNRRGVTLVLMVFMLTVLIGSAAFAVDFGRMYMFRAQLHSAADAAALAGTFRVSQPHLDRSDALDTAVSYGTRATVGGTAVGLAPVDVIPGSWTRAGGFVPDPDLNWNSSTVDAVQATTRYTGVFTFGKFFGFTDRPISATSVAVRGSVASATCVRPWGIPYQLMLNSLAAAFGGTPQDATTYDLTPLDVTHLSKLTIANNMALKVGDQSATVTNGNFYGVRLPPILYADGTLGNPWSGGNDYRTAEGASCATISAMMAAQGAGPAVGAGDWLQAENGNMIGPTMQGVQDLCGLSGSNYVCKPEVRITAALWDVSGDAPGTSGCGGKCFHVKYMGVFFVTGYDTVNDAVTGYFQTMSAAGEFSTAPGPIQTIALVK